MCKVDWNIKKQGDRDREGPQGLQVSQGPQGLPSLPGPGLAKNSRNTYALAALLLDHLSFGRAFRLQKTKKQFNWKVKNFVIFCYNWPLITGVILNMP